MLRPKYPNRRTYRPNFPLAKADEELRLLHGTITGRDAEQAILDYLREHLGEPILSWKVCYELCVSRRPLIRKEQVFYRRQMTRLIAERKVVRYHRGRFRDKVRISEAWV